MSPRPIERIRVREYEPRVLERHELSVEEAELLLERFGAQIDVDFPSPKTGGRWVLTPGGWVGRIPLSPEREIVLEPKVPIGNLFRMLEYAYDLKSLRFHDELTATDTLDDLYERLAVLLARRVLSRARRGLHRAYVDEHDRLPFVRGRLDMARLMRRPWSTHPHCHFEEHTADLEDNQILAWTLGRIVDSGLLTERGRPTVGGAFRLLRGAITEAPFRAEDCRGRHYHRLNDDYAPMHALCRFFLDRSGPTHTVGERTMIPFLLDMNRLFEQFVATWFQAHLPRELEAVPQVQFPVGGAQGVSFYVDVVLRDRGSGRAVAVLDTKYKAADEPAAADIAQVVTYAELAGCDTAYLVYPLPAPAAFAARIGRHDVRALSFDVGGDLDSAGAKFLRGVERRPPRSAQVVAA